MIAGRIAAQTLRELLRKDDLSERACAIYHERSPPRVDADVDRPNAFRTVCLLAQP
jgi:hypothetical protein